jgi:hypothetical protein
MALPTANNWFKASFEKMLERDAVGIDLNGGGLTIALFQNAWAGTANFDTDVGYGASPWNANEASGTGYSAGGSALDGAAVTVSGGVVKLDADDEAWAGSTITSRGAIIYDNSATNNEGICYLYFGGSDISSSSGTFTVQFHSSGILTLS